MWTFGTVVRPAIRCESAQVLNTPAIATPDSDQPPSSGRRANWVRDGEEPDERVVGEQDEVRRKRASSSAMVGGVLRTGPERPAGDRERDSHGIVASHSGSGDQAVAAAAERRLDAQRDEDDAGRRAEQQRRDGHGPWAGSPPNRWR